MYEFQLYSTVAQNGDALSMTTPGKTQNAKPETQNHRLGRPQTCPAGRPTAQRRRLARSPSASGRPRSPSQPPPATDVRRAEAPPVATHRPCSARERTSAPPSGCGQFLPTPRPPAAAPSVGRRRRCRRPGGGRPSPAPAAAACDGGRGRGHGHAGATVGLEPPPLAVGWRHRRVRPRLLAACRRVEADRVAAL